MLDNLMLFGAFVATLLGMGWFALAKAPHWKQVCNGELSTPASRILRIFGSSALFVSLVLCLAVDHASMASLVWVMLLAVAAVTIAFILALRPALLRFLSFPAKG